MSPRGRRLLRAGLQIALTAAALAVVFRMVRLQDAVRVRGGPPLAVRGVERSGGTAVVTWADGRREELPGPDVVFEQGVLPILAGAKPAWVALLTAGMLLPFGFMSARWCLLLRAHGFEVSFGRIFLVNYAGVFFNHLLPGGVGGDAAKAILAAEGEQRKAALVGTVVLDRIIGLAVLVYLGALCMLPFAGRFENRAIPYSVFGMAAAMAVGYALYVNPGVRRLLSGKVPFGRTLAPLDEVVRSLHARPRVTLVAAALSVLSQVVMILIIYALSRAMGLDQPPLWQFFAFEPIIFIVNALPISVGGLGVQEGMYVLLFGKLGALEESQAVALSLLYKACMVAASLPGGLLFALGAARRPPTPAPHS